MQLFLFFDHASRFLVHRKFKIIYLHCIRLLSAVEIGSHPNWLLKKTKINNAFLERFMNILNWSLK